MLREVCFLIGREGQVLWSDAGVSPVALADSRARWEAIWRLHEQLEEIAHSHPVGPLAFSREDETTMAALALALPRTPRFSIVAPIGMLVREAQGQGQRDDGQDHRPTSEPPWAIDLRQASGMQQHRTKEGEP
jgi:Prokaryotic homologs of the JAB domain